MTLINNCYYIFLEIATSKVRLVKGGLNIFVELHGRLVGE